MNTLKRVFGSSVVAAALIAGPALGYGDSHAAAATPLPLVQVNESGFGSPENTEVRLLKLSEKVGYDGRRLLAVASNAGGIQLWRSTNRLATEWEQQSESALVADTTNTDVVDIVMYKQDHYALLNSADGFELWRSVEGTDWEKVLEEHGVDTTATALGVMYNTLYVATTVASDSAPEAVVLKSTDGTTWETSGDAGIGLEVESVAGMEVYRGVAYAITSDSRVMSYSTEGVWTEVADLSESATALSSIQTLGKGTNRELFIGGQSENGAVVITTDDGEMFSAVVSDGFGNVENTSVTKFRVNSINKTVHAYTSNSNGFEVWETDIQGDLGSWTNVRSVGGNDADNTRVNDVVKFHGRVYGSTTNAVDGGQVYMLQMRAPSPMVTSPEMREEIAGSAVTITGTGQVGNRIVLRRLSEKIAETTVDEDGNWNIELTDLNVGKHHYKVVARYQGDDGLSGKWSLPTKVRFTTIAEL